VAALNVPVAVAPVIVIAARGVPSQRVIVAPAVGTGVCPQLTVLELVGLVPVQPALPVNVRTAEKLPLVPVGVKVARAGSIFCTHVPTPPLHVAALKVPVAVAPVIVIAASGVPSHLVMADPAVGTGV